MNAREEIPIILCTARSTSQPDAPKDEVVRDYMCETKDAPGSRPVFDFFIEMPGDYRVIAHEVTADKTPAAIDRVLKEKEAPSAIVPAGLDAI